MQPKGEIGSFLELDLKKTGEYFAGTKRLARLNTGRSGIYHSLKMLNCSRIYIPYYLCHSVNEFLVKKGIETIKYSIKSDFTPVLEPNDEESAVLIVNHFGLLSHSLMGSIKENYKNVIIDNCASFFSPAFQDCYNVYSCRKFFGVPDGCYVTGKDPVNGVLNYPMDQSSETSAFLLKRIEKGCNAVYDERMKNEFRIDSSDIMRMSDLTLELLSAIDYGSVLEKRQENFRYAKKLFKSFNLLDPDKFCDNESVPLFYPLVVRDRNLVSNLEQYSIYTGRRWKSVLEEVAPGSFEAYLSEYMVPLPIDQRYGTRELDYIFEVFKKVKNIDPEK